MESVIIDALNSAYISAITHAKNETKCCHLGCTLIINGKVDSTYTNNPERHAEIEALSSFGGANIEALRFLDCNLVIVRTLKDGKKTMAKPCKKCLPIIKKHGIKFVFYTNWEGTLVQERAAHMESTHISTLDNLKEKAKN